MTITRFAPSPTGRLHLGHVLAARVAHSLAREANGVFLLRHEDIDGPRVREEFYQGIEEDLKWLGLTWDGEPLRQTSRIAAYDAAFLANLDVADGQHLLVVPYPNLRSMHEHSCTAGTLTTAAPYPNSKALSR